MNRDEMHHLNDPEECSTVLVLGITMQVYDGNYALGWSPTPDGVGNALSRVALSRTPFSTSFSNISYVVFARSRSNRTGGKLIPRQCQSHCSLQGPTL